MDDLHPHTPYYMPSDDPKEPVFLTEHGKEIKDFRCHIASARTAMGYEQHFLPQHVP